MGRRGQIMIGFWEDPEVKKILQMEAIREGRPLSDIIRGLLREWLAKRNVRIPKVSQRGTDQRLAS